MTKFVDDFKLLRNLRTNADHEKMSRHLIILSGQAITGRWNSVCINMIHVGKSNPNFTYE